MSRNLFSLTLYLRRNRYRCSKMNCWQRWTIIFLLLTIVILSIVPGYWNEDDPDAGTNAFSNQNHGERKLNMVPTSTVYSGSTFRYEPVKNQFKATSEGRLVDPVRTGTESEAKNPAGKDLVWAKFPAELGENLLNYTQDPKDIPDPQWMLAKERQFQERSWRIQRICKQENVMSAPPLQNISNQYLERVMNPYFDEDPPVERPTMEHFSLAPKFRTMGCFVNKVASSSLMSAFLVVNGFGPSFNSPHSYAGFIRPRTSVDFRIANSTFFKFMFVRHPMDRLLSCYRDKMITSTHWSLPAFRRHVKQAAREIMGSRNVIFGPEVKTASVDARLNKLGKAMEVLNSLDDEERKRFSRESSKLHYVVQKIRKSSKPSQEAALTGADTPSFAEFLEYVLSTDMQGRGYDSHWVPYWRYCTPCNVPYDAVGKLETAYEDLKYVWQKTGLNQNVPIPWVNRQRAAKNEETERYYYSSLSRDLILRVYQRYRLDFLLFDYDINDVLVKAGYQPIAEQQS